MLKCTCVHRQPCGLLVLLREAAYICVGACGFLFSSNVACDDEGHMHAVCVDMSMCWLA